MLCSTSVWMKRTIGQDAFDLAVEISCYCNPSGLPYVKLCSKADSTHSPVEQPVSTGSNLPWRATNSYTCHETNTFW